jgi:hypothetical protein
MLGSNHKRYLLNALRHIDKLLTEAADRLNSGSPHLPDSKARAMKSRCCASSKQSWIGMDSSSFGASLPT